MGHGEVEHEGIELIRGHARLHMFGHEVECLGRQPASLCHAGESLRPM